MNIAIIDYNSGNLASLQNSLESAVKNNKQTFEVKISSSLNQDSNAICSKTDKND